MSTTPEYDLNVTVCDGKYTIRAKNGADLHALRYGMYWRDLVGDGLVLALATELQDAREKLVASTKDSPLMQRATDAPTSYTLDRLCEILRHRFGGPEKDQEYTQTEFADGSSEATLKIDGQIKATWKGRLVKMPPLDGVTPRGPKEYYDLTFL